MGLCGMAASYLVFSVLHFFQFVLAIAVCGLYGTDLHSAASQGKSSDPKWVYAVVVGALSALTSVLYLIPSILRFAFVWVWNAVLFVLWIALFGIFASMYLHADAQGDAGVQRMKNAVWVDLAGALLWLLAATGAFVYWRGHRERHSRFTGRAKV